jgi:hypothetical protein
MDSFGVIFVHLEVDKNFFKGGGGGHFGLLVHLAHYLYVVNSVALPCQCWGSYCQE